MTPLAVALLAVLTEGERHPYEMHQILIQRRRDKVVRLRPSSVYHTIERLEREGLVRQAGTDREGNRPERTLYALTDAGHAALGETIAEMLAEPATEFPEGDFAVSEAHYLSREKVVELIDQRLAALQGRLAVVGDSYKVWEGEVERRYLIHLPYRMALLRAEIDWLSQWQADLRSGELPW